MNFADSRLTRDEIVAQITPLFDANKVRTDSDTLQSHGCDHTKLLANSHEFETPMPHKVVSKLRRGL